MAKKRIEISGDLAAKVLFASDKTCCVCRDSTRKTKIHHIDLDPSNNNFENLAVLCEDCHSEAHTTHAFARNHTPELIRLYNTSWREIVRLHLQPAQSTGILREYSIEALLDLALAPHSWKNHYFSLYPGHFADQQESSGDVWDMLVNRVSHEYSEMAWKRYLPLFDISIRLLIDRLERLVMLHSNVIPVELKITVIRTTRQLDVERSAYLITPKIIDTVEDRNLFFTYRFTEVSRILGELARNVDQIRKSMKGDT